MKYQLAKTLQLQNSVDYIGTDDIRYLLDQKGNTPTIFLQQLECRLDNIVYRLRFAASIFGAQQLVSHGHVMVDGKKVDRRSFLVKPGMTVSIRPSSRQMKPILAAQENISREIPEYLSLESESKKTKNLVTVC